jgi:hypothetical protein
VGVNKNHYIGGKAPNNEVHCEAAGLFTFYSTHTPSGKPRRT